MKFNQAQHVPFTALRQRALTLLKNIVALIKKPTRRVFKKKQPQKRNGFCIYCLLPKQNVHQHMTQCKFKHALLKAIENQSTPMPSSSPSSSGTYVIPY